MRKLYYILFCFLLVSASAYADAFPKNKENPSSGYDRSNPYPQFTHADTLRGELTPLRACYDVRFYDISVAVFPETKSIKGDVSMDFLFVDSMQTVMQIDLSSKLEIVDLSIDGTPVSDYRREYNGVFIKLPENFSTTNEHRLTCLYGGTPIEAVRPPWEGGLVWKTSPSGKPWCGVTCETLGASCWIPCKDHLSDEPERGMKMRIDAPLGLTAVSNGLLVSHETIDDRELWTWQTNYPINSYNMTFYIGDFIHFGEDYKGIEATFPLNYYVLPEDEGKARKSFEEAKDVIAFYEEIYGPYPWPNEGYKLVESPFEGMEHQTAIAYGSGFKAFSSSFPMDYIIVHETAHEWWGNSITVDDYAEIFIHEGFAMYSEFLYVEHKFGPEKAHKYALMWERTMKNIRPVVGPRDVNFWDYHDTDPYVKGAWCLKGLRYLLNDDELFFDIIKSYYQSRKYSIVTVKDFTDFVNQKTGKDYSWYFKQFLYSVDYPVLECGDYSYKVIKNATIKPVYLVSDTTHISKRELLYVYLRWQKVVDGYAMPVVLYDTTISHRLTITAKGGLFAIEDSDDWKIATEYFRDLPLKQKKRKGKNCLFMRSPFVYLWQN